MAATIDVIGSCDLTCRRNLDKPPPKRNVIQVTVDKRGYSRKPSFPDMGVSSPGAGIPPPFDMLPPGYRGEPTSFYTHTETDPCYSYNFYS